jgi:MFS family permease
MTIPSHPKDWGEIEPKTTALRSRSFRRLWIAQFCAVTAIYALSLGGALLVEERTHSSAQIGLVILSSILPAFLGSLVSGAVVDRWGRRRVLMASHLARALAALAFWVGIGFGSPGLALATIYTVNVAGAIFTQFATPAELALLPDLVDRSSLVSANSLLQVGTLVAEGVGIVVMGPLVNMLLGGSTTGLMGTVLCLLSLALVAQLPRDQASVVQHQGTITVWGELRADLQAGWRVIVRDQVLSLVVIQATIAATLLLVLLSLLPGLVSRHLDVAVEAAPLLVLPGGLGFVLGAMLMSRWEGRMSQRLWIATGLTGVGISIGLLSLFSSGAGRLWIVLPLIFGLGLALALVVISARVVLQERPPAEVRGRVIAAQLALANAAAVLPLLLGGALADHLGIRPVMGLLGLLAVGAGAIGLHQVRG